MVVVFGEKKILIDAKNLLHLEDSRVCSVPITKLSEISFDIV